MALWKKKYSVYWAVYVIETICSRKEIALKKDDDISHHFQFFCWSFYKRGSYVKIGFINLLGSTSFSANLSYSYILEAKEAAAIFSVAKSLHIQIHNFLKIKHLIFQKLSRFKLLGAIATNCQTNAGWLKSKCNTSPFDKCYQENMHFQVTTLVVSQSW